MNAPQPQQGAASQERGASVIRLALDLMRRKQAHSWSHALDLAAERTKK